MSEYQYYEWQTIDRPLSGQERAEVDSLSSHITVTASGAWVEYSWSSFKHDSLEVLARYFDAFLYEANWGSKQLAFRFPAALLDPWPLQRFIVEPDISLQTMGDYQVLSFALDDEEPADYWIEPGNWLGALTPLRNDILRGDHRALYLAWLRAVEVDNRYEIAPDEPEPPVPPGLNQPTTALQNFADWAGLDEQLLAAAAQASAALAHKPAPDLASAIRSLSREECDEYLLRLVEEEPHLAFILRRRLEELLGSAQAASTPPQRRVEDLLAMRKEMQAEEAQRKAAAARRRFLQEMEDLAGREADVWRAVKQLIATYGARDYDEAVAHLVKLRQLAEHRNTLPAFQAQVNGLAERYRRRSSLISRLRANGLI